MNNIRNFVSVTTAKRQARIADSAAREMAKHCDRRIKRMVDFIQLVLTAKVLTPELEARARYLITEEKRP